MSKNYIRADQDVLKARCPQCGKVIYKNNPNQIVFFCSKACRRSYKEVKNELVKEIK